jgi:hypothetical protein
MVPYRHNAEMPLLPYEKQLIEALGCTEQEYREFIQWRERRVYVRPSGYEHVPDVQADLVTIAINLIIGIALTAASYLLTPKPKLDSPAGVRQKQLGGVSGLTNYAPTQGFESIQDLASYGNVVPIAFTRREDHPEGFSTGGLVISPSLVWSRMKSWGGFQVLEIVAVAGQGKMAKPDRAGILIGNNALDGIYDRQFQFYWNGGYEATGPNSRLRGANLRYGDLQVPAPPAANEDAFDTPTRLGTNDLGFCGAFTPSNQTRFGVYSGIPNGTPYRPNWEIISVLDDAADESKDQAITNQKKFVDPTLRETHPYGGGAVSGARVKSGMPGTGRNYGRHVGVVSHNGYVLPDPSVGTNSSGYRQWDGPYKTERFVEKNDVIEIYVGYGRQKTSPFSAFGDSVEVRLDDIRSTIDAEAVEFDREFALGAIFMIGRSTWQVIERPTAPFNTGGSHAIITLKCLESWSTAQNKIGIVAKAAILENESLPYLVDIDETWYPILKVDIGSIRNTRPCEVTEIGIKSQVWTRFNGITNFNSIPSPSDLYRYNAKNVQVREGKNTSYGHRVSFFALDVRPANSEPYEDLNKNEGFVNLTIFAVSGSTPQDIFSFIRIRHPDRAAYEFRLRPFNSAVISQQGDGNSPVFELNGAFSPYTEQSFDTYLGTFAVGGRGRYIKPRDYYTHYQMVAKPELLGSLVYGEWVPGTPRLELLGVFSNASNAVADARKVSNIISKFCQDQGAADYDPYFVNLPVGYIKVISGWTYDRDAPARSMVMTLTLKAYQLTIPGTSRDKWWQIVKTEIASVTGAWVTGDTFSKNYADVAGEQWRFEYRYVVPPTTYVEYDTPRSATRVWETYSGIAEVSHYGDLINRSCDNGPEHEVVYVNESLAEDRLVEYKGCAMMGLKLQSSNNFNSLDQVRCYMKDGLEVERLTDGGTGSSNLFTDLLWYLATNTDTGAGNIIDPSLIDRDQLAATGSYLRANRLFYDDAVSQPTNLRTWLSEKAPSMLCFVAIKNGKLSVNPALPTDTNGVIANTAPPISAMFTDGNIIENSFNLEWLELEERKLFQAAVVYRRAPLNKLPQRETVVVRYANSGGDSLPLEEFTLDHITSESHAIKAAKYFLALRKHITHTVSFRTLPYGLSLAPGEFIMVAVEQSPYAPANNGIVQSDGTVVSVTALVDGSYPVYYWDRSQSEVGEGVLNITGGIAQNLRNTVFSLQAVATTTQVYQVEALDVDQDGIVTVKASCFPVDSQGYSLVAADVVSDNNFEIVGQGAE